MAQQLRVPAPFQGTNVCFQGSLDSMQSYAHEENSDFKEIENILNDIQFLIFEATDVIDNLIDELQGNFYF